MLLAMTAWGLLVRNDRHGDGRCFFESIQLSIRNDIIIHSLTGPHFWGPLFFLWKVLLGVSGRRTISHFCLPLQIYPANLQQYDMLRIDK